MSDQLESGANEIRTENSGRSELLNFRFWPIPALREWQIDDSGHEQYADNGPPELVIAVTEIRRQHFNARIVIRPR